ncbi:hypothetical protein WOLCODRAFT_109190 [Wolfiporia cocos MD-104 SS10]|uniref:Uncharacterized protein n=1 Tax=Wolfiporia cocos (strain MD-104) TaxID=742152 RepID=A0A2H3JDJ1_WOLCO|nr:hypothetical protein WOLCODRAFT_109190 [Wolfiporia cocos MD-104 SS10]
MRHALRHAGPLVEALVRDVESAAPRMALRRRLLAPDDAAPLAFPGTPLDETGVMGEVQRAPLGLVWSVPDDAPARYVVHCCARFHGVVSFSKDDPTHRLTHPPPLPERNPVHPRAAPAPDTSPPMDLSEYYSSDASSDAGSERDPDETFHLKAIAEVSAPGLLSDDEWSVVDADA